MVKHELLAAHDERGPSRFYYAVPQGLVTVEEVPVWAGLIEIREGRYGVGWPTITRQAPRLHDQKAPDELAGDIRRILTYRFWHLVTSDHQKLDITPEGASA